MYGPFPTRPFLPAFPKPPPGNSAREAMIGIMKRRATWDQDAEDAADYVLALLRAAGFKVAPMTHVKHRT